MISDHRETAPILIPLLSTGWDIRHIDSNIRQCNSLHMPRTHTDTGAKSIVVREPTLWNKLPDKVKQEQSRSPNECPEFLFHQS